MKTRFLILCIVLFMLIFAGDCDHSDVKEVGGDGDKYGYTTESDKDGTLIYGSDKDQAKKNKKEYDKEIYPELEKQRKESF